MVICIIYSDLLPISDIKPEKNTNLMNPPYLWSEMHNLLRDTSLLFRDVSYKKRQLNSQRL